MIPLTCSLLAPRREKMEGKQNLELLDKCDEISRLIDHELKKNKWRQEWLQEKQKLARPRGLRRAKQVKQGDISVPGFCHCSSRRQTHGVQQIIEKVRNLCTAALSKF
jgi:hypothetical protein